MFLIDKTVFPRQQLQENAEGIVISEFETGVVYRSHYILQLHFTSGKRNSMRIYMNIYWFLESHQYAWRIAEFNNVS